MAHASAAAHRLAARLARTVYHFAPFSPAMVGDTGVSPPSSAVAACTSKWKEQIRQGFEIVAKRPSVLWLRKTRGRHQQQHCHENGRLKTSASGCENMVARDSRPG